MEVEMNAVTTTAPPKVESIDKRIGQYVKLRDKIAELKKKHEAELKPFTDALVMLNGVLLDHLNTSGGDSLTVRGVGTAYKTVKKSASVADPGVFKAFVIERGRWDLIDFRANSTGVEAYINEGWASPPPGVNFRQIAVVGVRRADESDTESAQQGSKVQLGAAVGALPAPKRLR
jgi:hypothetical protein